MGGGSIELMIEILLYVCKCFPAEQGAWARGSRSWKSGTGFSACVLVVVEKNQTPLFIG